MSTLNSFLIAGLVLCSTISCANPPKGANPIKPLVQAAPVEASLLEQLIDALNSANGAGLEAFVKEHASSAVPVADRVERMKGLVEQGAPFKIVKLLPAGPNELKAVVSDKNGMQLSFRVTLTTDAKIDRVAIAPADAGSSPTKNYSNWTTLQSLVDTIRADIKTPAIGVAMIRSGKSELAISGVRELGKPDAVTSDEPWSIGSIGKSICSTVIGRLIENGKLRWDETIAEALPDLLMKEGYKGVTLEQLMHHRGGVPEDPGMRRSDVERIVAGATDPTIVRLNYAKNILSRDIIAKPGERFAYSNAGYTLLGVIAERATGKSYERLIHELIFDPLGLKHSYTYVDKLPDSRPSGHVAGPDGLRAVNFDGPIEMMFAPAGGGLFMSLSDLAKFGEAHLKGLLGKDGLLKSETIKRLHQGIAEDDPKGRQYACGWGLEQFPGIELMHMHNGSNGTMRAQLSIFPESNLVVASIMNAGGEGEPSPPLQAVLAVASKFAKKP